MKKKYLICANTKADKHLGCQNSIYFSLFFRCFFFFTFSFPHPIYLRVLVSFRQRLHFKIVYNLSSLKFCFPPTSPYSQFYPSSTPTPPPLNTISICNCLRNCCHPRFFFFLFPSICILLLFVIIIHSIYFALFFFHPLLLISPFFFQFYYFHRHHHCYHVIIFLHSSSITAILLLNFQRVVKAKSMI